MTLTFLALSTNFGTYFPFSAYPGESSLFNRGTLIMRTVVRLGPLSSGPWDNFFYPAYLRDLAARKVPQIIQLKTQFYQV